MNQNFVDNQDELTTLADQVKLMHEDELLSRFAKVWHNIEELRRRARYDHAQEATAEYEIYRLELLYRLTYRGAVRKLDGIVS